MAAPKFSVGVNADPMVVEKTIGKTLDEIIKERRKEQKGPGGAKGGKNKLAGRSTVKGKESASSKAKAAQLAKSVGTGKAKRAAALAKRRGSSDGAKVDASKIEAEVQRSKNQQSKKKARAQAAALIANTKGASKAKAKAKAKVKTSILTAAPKVKRGGPRPGGKKKGFGHGGPKQSAQSVKPEKREGSFHIGVKGNNKQQKQSTGVKTRGKKGAVGTNGNNTIERETRSKSNRKKKKGAADINVPNGVRSSGRSKVTTSAASRKADTKNFKPKKTKLNRNSTFIPDQNLQISFRNLNPTTSSSGSSNHKTSYNAVPSNSMFNSPAEYSKSPTSHAMGGKRGTPASFLSPTFHPSHPPFNDGQSRGFASRGRSMAASGGSWGGGIGRNSATAGLVYRPPVRNMGSAEYGRRGGSPVGGAGVKRERHSSLRNVHRSHYGTVDRGVTMGRSARAGVLDGKRNNSQWTGRAGRGSSKAGSNRRVILLGR